MYLSGLSKIYASNLLADPEDWVSPINLMPNMQTGFRAGMGTLTNISAVKLLANQAFAKSRTLYACFIDLKAAFDKVPRASLWAKMQNWGAPSKHLEAIIFTQTRGSK